MKEKEKYFRTLYVSKSMDDEIMRRLKKAQAVYPPATKNGIVANIIRKGLPLLKNFGDFVIHHKGVDYVSINVSVNLKKDEKYIKTLNDKFQAGKTMILYSALVKGIEKGESENA